ncbi:glycoside hydrolase family 2 TIM barrel-domain containing protein [Pedobacter sp. KBW01]|uniref:glycoside hydrolase family 2 TIM barrel-domain containing protein n=1 Tax=Pedobacter sp. KBW01 TaxID=2153364 RepID=UPI00131A3FAB|nr:glycoside hydrolase family 2 TIM barrel-domain containing protein [Pedobacter sp. KBW01]
MRINFRLFALLLTLFNISYSYGQDANPSPRLILNLNTRWAFFRGEASGAEAVSYNDNNWTGVSVPHTMRLEPKHNGGNQNYTGIGWYRRYFKIDKANSGKRITLNFDGVQKNCEIYLNGEKLKVHYGGYLGFIVDISDKVKFNDNNLLAVRVSNVDDPFTPPGKMQDKMDFLYYGGIYRDVSLQISNKIHISDPLEAQQIAGGGLFITFPEVNKQKATISIKTHVLNQSKTAAKLAVVTTLEDKNGQKIAFASSSTLLSAYTDQEYLQKMVVLKPKLWHPDHPYLYQLVSKVYCGKTLVDLLVSPIGIRTISFSSPAGKANGFYLNGEKLYLRGANRHQSYQNIGDAASASMQWRDALQIKKGGFNSVRASHYPQSPRFLDACDKLGLLVIECEPGWQFFNKDTVFIQRSYQQVREMIRRDRNRPSVFLWETSLNESPTPDFWAKEVVRIAHEEIPGKQMFTADDFFAKGRKYYDVSYKVINEDATDPMPSMPSLTREWGDTWIADPKKENGLRASRIYTAKGLIAQCKLRQNALNGTMLEEEGGYWDHARLDANARIGGYFLWSFNDYTRGSDPVTAFSGVVDIDRYEKFGYYQLMAMQNARNPAYGPMVFIASYNNQPEIDSNLIVFSNCDKVRLLRNNVLLKEISREQNAKTAPFISGKGGSPYFEFKTGSYQAGTLRAEGILNGKVVCSHLVRTPEKPDHLEIEIAESGIKPVADGSDMVPVYIKICDKNGTVITNTSQLQSYQLNLKVSGKGTLIGANSARLNISSQQSEGGIGYGIIRTLETAGDILITASSPGIKSANTKITTIPFKGIYARDGEHPKWKNEAEITDTIGRIAKPDELPPMIKLTPDMLSSSESTVTSRLEKLIDGDPRSILTVSRESLPITLKIDLGKPVNLRGSRLIWGKDSDWYTYSLAGSADGIHWIDLIKERKVSGQDYKPVFYEGKDSRYLKIKLLDVQPEKSKLAIGELELYGF